MLTEARVILPGAPALFGFQLVIVLMAAFETCRTDPAWSCADGDATQAKASGQRS